MIYFIARAFLDVPKLTFKFDLPILIIYGLDFQSAHLTQSTPKQSQIPYLIIYFIVSSHYLDFLIGQL